VKKLRTPKLLVETAREKLTDSTIHGSGMFFRSEHWTIRIMWVCFGLAPWGYLIYLMTKIMEYQKNEVWVEISRKFELPAVFPAITICNVNLLNEMYAYNYTLSKVGQAACFKLKNGTELSQCINSTDVGSSFDSFIMKMKRIIANDKTLTDYDYYWYGFNLETDMMLSFKFNVSRVMLIISLNFGIIITETVTRLTTAISMILKFKNTLKLISLIIILVIMRQIIMHNYRVFLNLVHTAQTMVFNFN